MKQLNVFLLDESPQPGHCGEIESEPSLQVEVTNAFSQGGNKRPGPSSAAQIRAVTIARKMICKINRDPFGSTQIETVDHVQDPRN